MLSFLPFGRGGRGAVHKRAHPEPTTEESDAPSGRDIFKGFFETELRLERLPAPATRAARAQQRSAFINFCDKELRFLQEIDATCCLLIVAWIYTRRARLEIAEYTPSTLFLFLHLACSYWEDDEGMGELVLHRVVGQPPRHPARERADKDADAGSVSPDGVGRYTPRKEDPSIDFFEKALPQNWSFDRKEIRKYLNKVRSFFQARDKLLRHLSYELHVTLDEVAKEMNEFPKCSLFFLDPLTDNEAAREPAQGGSDDSDEREEGDDEIDDEE